MKKYFFFTNKSMPLKFTPVNRTKESVQKKIAALNKILNDRKYAKIIDSFATYVLRNGIQDIPLIRDNFNILYDVYKERRGDRDFDSSDSSIAAFFIELYSNNTFELYEVKEVQDDDRSTTSSPATQPLYSPVRSSTASLAPIVEENVDASPMRNELEQQVAYSIEDVVKSEPIKRKKTLNDFDTDNIDYVSVFNNLKLNIPSKIIRYYEGHAHIDPFDENEGINLSKFQVCPYHTDPTHKHKFIDLNPDFTKNYGYILPDGTVYDLCYEANQNISISDEVIVKIKSYNEPIKKLFTTIESSLKQLLDFFSESIKNNTIKASIKANLNTQNINLRNKIVSQYVIKDVSVVLNSLLKIEPKTPGTINLVVNPPQNNYSYDETKFLIELSKFFKEYHDFFNEYHEIFFSIFANDIFNLIFTYEGFRININNYVKQVEKVREKFNRSTSSADELTRQLNYVVDNIRYINKPTFMLDLRSKTTNDIKTQYEEFDPGFILPKNLKVMKISSLYDFKDTDSESEALKGLGNKLNTIFKTVVNKFLSYYLPPNSEFFTLEFDEDDDIIDIILSGIDEPPFDHLSAANLDKFKEYMNTLKRNYDIIMKFVKDEYDEYEILKSDMSRILSDYEIDDIIKTQSDAVLSKDIDEIVSGIKNSIKGIVGDSDIMNLDIYERKSLFDSFLSDNNVPSSPNDYERWVFNFRQTLKDSNIYKIKFPIYVDYYINSGKFNKNTDERLIESKKSFNTRGEAINTNIDLFKIAINECNVTVKTIKSLNVDLTNTEQKLNNINRELTIKENEIINEFIKYIPVPSILINKYKSKMPKIPYRSFEKNIMGILNFWLQDIEIIYKKLLESKRPKVKRLLAVFKQNQLFYEMRSNMFNIFNNRFGIYKLHDFNTIMSNVINTLRDNQDFLLGEKDYTEYNIIDNIELRNIFDINGIKYKNVSLDSAVNSLKTRKEIYLKAQEIIAIEESAKIGFKISQKIVENVTDEILNNSVSLQEYNSDNPYSSNFFKSNNLMNSITVETQDNILKIKSRMIRILDQVEKSHVLIDHGPGMYYFYNTLVTVIDFIKTMYTDILGDNENVDIIVSDEQISFYNKFNGLIVPGNIQSLITSEKFDSFSALLTGTLSTPNFVNETIYINNFKSPYRQTDILTREFIVSVLKMTDDIFKKVEFDEDTEQHYISYETLGSLVDENFPPSKLEGLERESLESDDVRISTLLQGISDLCINVDTFRDEYYDRRGRIVSYDVFMKYRSGYTFVTKKSYMDPMLASFETMFIDIINNDRLTFQKTIIEMIITYFDRFNDEFKKIEDIEKSFM